MSSVDIVHVIWPSYNVPVSFWKRWGNPNTRCWGSSSEGTRLLRKMLQRVRHRLTHARSLHGVAHPDLSGCITSLIVRNGGCNLCAAMDTLIDQDGRCVTSPHFVFLHSVPLNAKKGMSHHNVIYGTHPLIVVRWRKDQWPKISSFARAMDGFFFRTFLLHGKWTEVCKKW